MNSQSNSPRSILNDAEIEAIDILFREARRRSTFRADEIGRELGAFTYHSRRMRDAAFGDLAREIFAEPSWDMLLDLLHAHRQDTRISISSACIASCSPPTTALRHLDRLQQLGLIDREGDDHDRRRAFLSLTPRCLESFRIWEEKMRR